MRVVALLVLAACGRIGFDPGGAPGDGAGDTIVTPAQFLTGYDRRKQIRISPMVDTDVADVPISVFLANLTDIPASAMTDGSDFAVTAADGMTLLGHEVVSYEPSPGRLDLWIRVPQLSGSTDTIAYLYYGGVSRVPTSAWPALYRGVWHMTEVGGLWPDSAGNNHGTQPVANLRPTVFGGLVGNSADFDGSNDTIEIQDPPNDSLDFGTTSFAYSLWVNVDQTSNEFDVVMTKGGFDNGSPGYDMELGNNDWEALLSDGTSGFGARFGTASEFVGTGIWFQLLAVVDREADLLRAFVGGEQTATDDISTLGSVDNGFPLELGRSVDHFRDRLDEVRIYAGIPEPERLAIERVNFLDRDRVVVGPEELR